MMKLANTAILNHFLEKHYGQVIYGNELPSGMNISMSRDIMQEKIRRKSQNINSC